jgi:hypothetical protein
MKVAKGERRGEGDGGHACTAMKVAKEADGKGWRGPFMYEAPEEARRQTMGRRSMGISKEDRRGQVRQWCGDLRRRRAEWR